MDGHHRVLAYHLLNRKEIPIYRNKLTRIQIDTGTKDFTPKPYFTDEDIRKSKSPGVKPSITIRRQKLKEEFVPGLPTREVESEFGIRIGEDYKGVFFGKKFKKGGEVNIPRAASEPDERIDKMTGRPYDQQAGTAFVDEEDPLRRLGFVGGGQVDPLRKLGFGV